MGSELLVDKEDLIVYGSVKDGKVSLISINGTKPQVEIKDGIKVCTSSYGTSLKRRCCAVELYDNETVQQFTERMKALSNFVALHYE